MEIGNVNGEFGGMQAVPQSGKKKIILVIAVLVGGLLVGTLCGYFAGVNAKINAQLLAERQAQDEQINTKKEELSNLENEIKDKSGVISAAKEYETNKATLDEEIAEKTSTVENLDSQISAKQSELDILTGNVVKAKSEPKVLPAGEYTVGVDIPAGRYSVSGSRNFFAWDKSGSLKVNTILGNSSIGVGDYVCSLGDGYRIECAAKTTFTPIQ